MSKSEYFSNLLKEHFPSLFKSFSYYRKKSYSYFINIAGGSNKEFNEVPNHLLEKAALYICNYQYLPYFLNNYNVNKYSSDDEKIIRQFIIKVFLDHTYKKV